MARTITADTFHHWWAALDERANQEGGAKEWSWGSGLKLSAANVLRILESCASPISFDHDGRDPDRQWIRRVTTERDTVVLDRPPDEGGDEFIEDLIRNIVALTGIEPEYVDDPVPGNDIEPMVERLREARDARNEYGD